MKQLLLIFSTIFIFQMNGQITSFIEVNELPQMNSKYSGSVYYNNILYAVGNRGSGNTIQKIDPNTGKEIGDIKVENAINYDWEAMTQDDKHIFIGDIGNKSGNRQNLRIYKIAKRDLEKDRVQAEILEFEYKDQEHYINQYENHNYDAEAMTIINGALYIFSKNWKNGETKMYRLWVDKKVQSAQLICTFDVGGWINGANFNEENRSLQLIGNGTKPFVVEFKNFQPNADNLELEKYYLPTSFNIAEIGFICGFEKGYWIGSVHAKGENKILNSMRLYYFELKSSPAIKKNNNQKVDAMIYPNPSSNEISILTENEILDVQVFSFGGLKQNIIFENSNKVNIHKLNKGNYLMQINTDKGIVNKKLVKE